MRKGAAQYIEPMSDALPRRLLPSLCALCHGWSRSGRLCAACCARFVMPATRCRSCAIRVPQAVLRCHDCQRQPPPFARALVAVDYAYPWDGLLQRFKFGTALDLRDALAGLLAHAVQADDEPLPQLPQLLVPLPLSRKRLRERGYNQSSLLARGLAQRLGLPVEDGVLRRLVDTPPLSAHDRRTRARLVRGCFGVVASRAARLRGQRVALVDDVLTTGASAAEAARVLLDHGAAQVLVYAFARTPAPQDR